MLPPAILAQCVIFLVYYQNQEKINAVVVNLDRNNILYLKGKYLTNKKFNPDIFYKYRYYSINDELRKDTLFSITFLDNTELVLFDLDKYGPIRIPLDRIDNIQRERDNLIIDCWFYNEKREFRKGMIRFLPPSDIDRFELLNMIEDISSLFREF